MLNRLPTRMPSLNEMLHNIFNPHPKDIARALEVNEQTVRAWIKADDAPRTALLSLFWLTSWGMSLADAETFNRAQLAEGMVDCLLRENKRLAQEIELLKKAASYGAANEPSTAPHHASLPSGYQAPFRPLPGFAAAKSVESAPSAPKTEAGSRAHRTASRPIEEPSSLRFEGAIPQLRAKS